VLRHQQNATVLLDEVIGIDTIHSAASRDPLWRSPELRLSGPGDRVAIRLFRPQ
jgi:hypothetical protein